MENGLVAELIDETQESLESEGAEEWQNGLDILQNALEQSYLESDVLLEQSVEQSQVVTYSEAYDMGAYAGYNLQDVGLTLGSGVGVGFAVALCVALASWGVACAISILKKGGR